MVNNTQGLLNTYMGQSKLSDMQSLEDQDPNEVRFDSRRPVATNIKNMLEQRIKMDATLSAGRIGGSSSTPAPPPTPVTPASNPYRTKNAWFAPVANIAEDKAYATTVIEKGYNKMSDDEKKKTYYKNLADATKDVPFSKFTDYARTLKNADGSPMIGSKGGFTDFYKGTDLIAYKNTLERMVANIKDAPNNVWANYKVMGEVPGTNTNVNLEEKEQYNKDLAQIDAENKRRGEMGYQAELSSSPRDIAMAEILKDQKRQDKLKGVLDWGGVVTNKETGAVTGLSPQALSFSSPLPQIARPKAPKYTPDDGKLVDIGVPAGDEEPPRENSPGGGLPDDAFNIDLTGYESTGKIKPFTVSRGKLGKIENSAQVYLDGTKIGDYGEMAFTNLTPIAGKDWKIKDRNTGQYVHPTRKSDLDAILGDYSVMNLMKGKINGKARDTNYDETTGTQRLIIQEFYQHMPKYAQYKNSIDAQSDAIVKKFMLDDKTNVDDNYVSNGKEPLLLPVSIIKADGSIINATLSYVNQTDFNEKMTRLSTKMGDLPVRIGAPKVTGNNVSIMRDLGVAMEENNIIPPLPEKYRGVGKYKTLGEAENNYHVAWGQAKIGQLFGIK